MSTTRTEAAAPTATDRTPGIVLEVWSDVVCPWCYLGKRRLEHAIAAFERPALVEVRYRSYELDPRTPVGEGVPVYDYLGRRYGGGPEAGRAMSARVARAAGEEGLRMDFDRAVWTNTFDAHRMVHMGLAQGGPALQAAVKERLFAAHFEEGKVLDDISTLQRLGAEAGLDEHVLAAVLASDDYAEDVRADEAAARELGITTVPFVVANRSVALSGAQPVEVFAQLLHQAWRETGS
ncbi:DsbA family oxidoreductase [Oryzihumus sp.]